jgi:hypothetical protein
VGVTTGIVVSGAIVIAGVVVGVTTGIRRRGTKLTLTLAPNEQTSGVLKRGGHHPAAVTSPNVAQGTPLHTHLTNRGIGSNLFTGVSNGKRHAPNTLYCNALSVLVIRVRVPYFGLQSDRPRLKAV